MNIAARKFQMVKNRRLCEYTWEKYLETVYPEWWASIYYNRWPVHIIYYSDFDNKLAYKSAQEYLLYIFRYATMKDIKKYFRKLINNQIKAIKMCFGEELGELISNYLPININIDSYFYVHKSKFIDEGYYFVEKMDRYAVDDKMTLNQVSCAVRGNPPSPYIHLRFRNTPINRINKL